MHRLVTTLGLIALASICRGDLVLIEERIIGPDSFYRAYVDESVPLRVFVTEVPLGHPQVDFRVVAGNDNLYERETTTSAVARHSRPGHMAYAAINNDFGGPRSAPWGMFVEDGTLRVSPINRSSLAINADRRAHIELFTTTMSLVSAVSDCEPLTINHLNRWHSFTDGALYTVGWGRSEVRDREVVEVVLIPESPDVPVDGRVSVVIESVEHNMGGTPIAEDRWILHLPANTESSCLNVGNSWHLEVSTNPDMGDWYMVAGGVPKLVQNGRPIVNEAETYNKGGFATSRHPRTAVGINESRDRLIMVVIDGRQPGVSAGTTMQETADIMAQLGAFEALNVDGGGSSTMVVRGEIMNTPSDGHERATTSSFLVINLAPQGEPADLELIVPSRRVTAGAPVPLAVRVYDETRNELAPDSVDLQWVLPNGATMREDSALFAASQHEQTLTVRAQDSNLAASTGITAAPPHTMRMTTVPPIPVPGEPFEIIVAAKDESGRSLWLDSGALNITLQLLDDQAVATRSAPNRFTVSATGDYTASVMIGNREATHTITVRERQRRTLHADVGAGWTTRFLAVNENATTTTTGTGDRITVNYQFLPNETGAVYFETDRQLPDGTVTLLLPTQSSNENAMVRAVLANDADELFLLTLHDRPYATPGYYAAELTEMVAHWHNPQARMEPPFHLREIYVVQARLDARDEPKIESITISTPIAEGFFD